MIYCSGVLVFKENKDSHETLIVTGKKGGQGFPKGKRNKNESVFDCAVRELYEETGITKETIKFLKDVKFREKGILYYLALRESQEEHIIKYDTNELKQVKWYDINDALKLVMKNMRVRILSESYNIIRSKKLELLDFDEMNQIETKLTIQQRYTFLNKTLETILKHKDNGSVGINFDENGYAKIEDLLKLDQLKNFTEVDIEHVTNNDKKFLLSTVKSSICVNQELDKNTEILNEGSQDSHDNENNEVQQDK